MSVNAYEERRKKSGIQGGGDILYPEGRQLEKALSSLFSTASVSETMRLLTVSFGVP